MTLPVLICRFLSVRVNRGEGGWLWSFMGGATYQARQVVSQEAIR